MQKRQMLSRYNTFSNARYSNTAKLAPTYAWALSCPILAPKLHVFLKIMRAASDVIIA